MKKCNMEIVFFEWFGTIYKGQVEYKIFENDKIVYKLKVFDYFDNYIGTTSSSDCYNSLEECLAAQKAKRRPIIDSLKKKINNITDLIKFMLNYLSEENCDDCVYQAILERIKELNINI